MSDTSTSAQQARLRIDHGLTFEWSEPWNGWLESRDIGESLAWIHSGIAVTRTGDVIVISHGRAEAYVLSPDGGAVKAFDTGLTQGHGLRIAEEDGAEVLWIADNGSRRERRADGTYPKVDGAAPPRAVKMSLEGEHLMSIGAPDIPAYQSGTFSPTGIAIDEAALGGTGDIWIADGYGESYVHRFRQNGSYAMSLSSEEGGSRFDCPHAVWIDRRRDEPELYVSDRKNCRLQVFDLDGNYKRVVGSKSVFRRPGGFAVNGQYLVVAELDSRLTVLDLADEVIGHLGGDDAAFARRGFPNQLDDHAHPTRPTGLRPGYFNSPHGLAADAARNLYVNEFVIGGRIVKLTKVTD